MWWWQSQEPAGALSLGGSVPEEFGTCWAWLTPTEIADPADAIATIETLLMKVRRAINFSSSLVRLGGQSQSRCVQNGMLTPRKQEGPLWELILADVAEARFVEAAVS